MPDPDKPVRPATTWICPPPADAWPEWEAAVVDLRDRVRPLAAYHAHQPSMFGLELKCGFLAIQNIRSLPPADNDFWLGKVRVLFARPAIEPILASFWARSPTLALDRTTAHGLAKILTAGDARYREKRAYGDSPAGRVQFEPIDIARQWHEALARLGDLEAGITHTPVYLFARTIMAHPFEDGNGRFARALFLSALSRQLGLRYPCFGVAPSFYRHAERIGGAGGAMTTLSQTGQWAPLSFALIEAAHEAISLSKIASGLPVDQL